MERKNLMIQDTRSVSQRGTALAVRQSAALLANEPERADLEEFNLALLRRIWRRKHQGEHPRVAVCGWEMAHNAAGRVRTLADLWRPLAQTEVIGATFERWGKSLWQPLREMDLPCHTIHIEDEARFPKQALDLVLAHPYDVVHLSKPRFPNIIFGLLYKLAWDAKVILDIDDEELGTVQADAPLALGEYLENCGGAAVWEDLGGKDWTRTAVSLWDVFGSVTVSNPRLQMRYAGPIIPHARDAKSFEPSDHRRCKARERFNIPMNKSVVLFFGTPRRHKGLIDTARAISALGRNDLCYVIVGEFPDLKLKAELQAIEGADIRFLTDQPYESIPDVVAVGDICILLQSETSLLANYQLPAKLIDALAMGLVVLAQPTPVLMDAIKAGAVVDVMPYNLKETLARCLSDADAMRKLGERGRAYFLEHYASEKCRGDLQRFLQEERPLPKPGIILEDSAQRRLFDQLGGWTMFTPAETPKTVTKKGHGSARRPAAEPVSIENAGTTPASASAKATDKQRIIVYSALVGDYETVKEPEAIDPSVRYLLFTESAALKSDRWEVFRFDTLGLNARRASRLPKILPHEYLPDHDISVYLDSSLTMIEPDIEGMVKNSLQDSDIAAYPHFERDCTYEEIAECVKLGKTSALEATSVTDLLKGDLFPEDFGLVENAFLVRRNNSVMRELNEAWHKLFSEYAERDQFYLMYLSWKHAIPIRRIVNASQFRKSPHVRFTKHDWTRKPQTNTTAQIRWNHPARLDAVRSINWNRKTTN